MTARTESGVNYDPRALDAIERRFWRDCWESVPAQAAAEHGIEVARFGPVQATIVRELAAVRMINLTLGATEPEAIGGGHLAAAIEWARGRGVDPYLPVTPGLPTTGEAESFLRAAGFEPGYGWMKFVRDTHPPRFRPPGDVEVVELTGRDEAPFAAIVAAGFGLPAWCTDLFAGLPAHPDWRCYVARVDGKAQATAAMLIDGGIAEFGMAATLEPARRRGCQAALLHRRIVDAAAAGCELLFVETGEPIPSRPSNSYRNVLRAGFEEAYICPNWQAAEPRTSS